MTWMKWASGEKVNLRHDAEVQVRIQELVGKRWVEVSKEVIPVRSLGGHHVVESYLRPYMTLNRRRMQWRPRVEDVLPEGTFCTCTDCIEKWGSS